LTIQRSLIVLHVRNLLDATILFYYNQLVNGTIRRRKFIYYEWTNDARYTSRVNWSIRR